MSESSSGGIGLTSVVGVVFVTLKLTHVISWSWWWVLAPFWGQVVLGLITLAIADMIVAGRERRIREDIHQGAKPQTLDTPRRL